MRNLLIGLTLFSCKAKSPTVTPVETTIASNPTTTGVSDPRLSILVAESWDGTMKRYPSWASAVGDHRFDGETTDSSADAEQAFLVRQRSWITRLKALGGLNPSDALTRDLLVGELEGVVGQAPCRFGDWSFSPRDNPMLDANDEGERFIFDSFVGGMALVRRLEAQATDIGVRTERIRAGLADGLVANRRSTELVIEQTRRQLLAPLDDSPLLLPLKRVPDAFSPSEREQFEAALRTAAQHVHDSLEHWVTMLETEVLPAARTELEGLAGLPQADACYAATILHHTSLPLTAEALHQTGLDEIERLKKELGELGLTTVRSDDPAEIFRYLREEPSLYFQTEQQVEDKAREALARAKAAIPAYFGRLPAADCVVERVPDYQAPYTTIAYYQPLVPGERPGAYFINTYQPETRPRHEAEVLAFHESIPGHHLQIALAAESGDIPLFRRHLRVTAFVEGWALYSEQLADEMGLYTDDVDRLGMYSFELWRAARLVVDTGIHAKGWTRQEAVDFMKANTPLAENNIVNEVDRYLTTPGQALAYKTGQLEIWALRRDAEARLGERFDLKGFHDTVLGSGAVSLPVLRKNVDAWVIARKK